LHFRNVFYEVDANLRTNHFELFKRIITQKNSVVYQRSVKKLYRNFLKLSSCSLLRIDFVVIHKQKRTGHAGPVLCGENLSVCGGHETIEKLCGALELLNLDKLIGGMNLAHAGGEHDRIDAVEIKDIGVAPAAGAGDERLDSHRADRKPAGGRRQGDS